MEGIRKTLAPAAVDEKGFCLCQKLYHLILKCLYFLKEIGVISNENIFSLYLLYQ